MERDRSRVVHGTRDPTLPLKDRLKGDRNVSPFRHLI
jgi:hypothetical protein